MILLKQLVNYSLIVHQPDAFQSYSQALHWSPNPASICSWLARLARAHSESRCGVLRRLARRSWGTKSGNWRSCRRAKGRISIYVVTVGPFSNLDPLSWLRWWPLPWLSWCPLQRFSCRAKRYGGESEENNWISVGWVQTWFLGFDCRSRRPYQSELLWGNCPNCAFVKMGYSRPKELLNTWSWIRETWGRTVGRPIYLGRKHSNDLLFVLMFGLSVLQCPSDRDAAIKNSMLE